ncbi:MULTISPECIES: hypothetical protein [unclassified Pseudomonas]|uniref:hypothetical protein n=1 Tax=unclassified Pseudomonas TaxID=196821 RepID=UPI000A1FADBD|nr:MULTISPECIES: hypothetical protein [unclassified Pseudomonas]MDI2142865.1 hypothetical protein [Pseudomonas sp. ITA]
MNTDVGVKTFICAGTVVLVADELLESDRCDGLDALLYAQLVASHKCPDLTQVDSWNQANKTALRVTGAMLLDNPHASLPVPMPGSFTLAELIRRIFHQWVPAATDEVVGSSLTLLSMQASSGHAMEVLLQHSLHEGKWVRFGFSLLSRDLSVSTVFIAFEVDEVIEGNLLCHRFNTANVLGNVSIDGYKALFDPEDYVFSRDKVIALLGDRRQEQIIALA